MGDLRLGLNLRITRLPIFLANLKRIGYEKSRKKQDTTKRDASNGTLRQEALLSRSSDTVSMRITPNGSCRRPTNNKEDPYNGII